MRRRADEHPAGKRRCQRAAGHPCAGKQHDPAARHDRAGNDTSRRNHPGVTVGSNIAEADIAAGTNQHVTAPARNGSGGAGSAGSSSTGTSSAGTSGNVAAIDPAAAAQEQPVTHADRGGAHTARPREPRIAPGADRARHNIGIGIETDIDPGADVAERQCGGIDEQAARRIDAATAEAAGRGSGEPSGDDRPTDANITRQPKRLCRRLKRRQIKARRRRQGRDIGRQQRRHRRIGKRDTAAYGQPAGGDASVRQHSEISVGRHRAGGDGALLRQQPDIAACRNRPGGDAPAQGGEPDLIAGLRVGRRRRDAGIERCRDDVCRRSRCGIDADLQRIAGADRCRADGAAAVEFYITVTTQRADRDRRIGYQFDRAGSSNRAQRQAIAPRQHGTPGLQTIAGQRRRGAQADSAATADQRQLHGAAIDIDARGCVQRAADAGKASTGEPELPRRHRSADKHIARQRRRCRRQQRGIIPATLAIIGNQPGLAGIADKHRAAAAGADRVGFHRSARQQHRHGPGRNRPGDHRAAAGNQPKQPRRADRRHRDTAARHDADVTQCQHRNGAGANVAGGSDAGQAAGGGDGPGSNGAADQINTSAGTQRAGRDPSRCVDVQRRRCGYVIKANGVATGERQAGCRPDRR